MRSTWGVIVLIIGLSLSSRHVYSQDWELDADARIRGGVPFLVTVSIAFLAESSGGPRAGQRWTSSQYLYDDRGQLKERVSFEEGQPVEYICCTYDESHRLASKVTKTATSRSSSYFSYAPGKSIEIIQPDAAGASSWTEREQLRAQGAQSVHWVRFFDANGTLTRASRTVRDSLGRAIETIFYAEDGSPDSVRRLEYQDQATLEAVLDGESEAEQVTRTVYHYDARDNWIESTSYSVHANQDTEHPEPLFRMYRDIIYQDQASNTEASIEPAKLFPRRQQAPPETTSKVWKGTSNVRQLVEAET